jgi:hypothetical protein
MSNTNQKVVETRAQRVVDQLLRETFTPDDDLPSGPSGRGNFPSSGGDRSEFPQDPPSEGGEGEDTHEERTEVDIANEILAALDSCEGEDQTSCLEQVRGLANELLALHGAGPDSEDSEIDLDDVDSDGPPVGEDDDLDAPRQ